MYARNEAYRNHSRVFASTVGLLDRRALLTHSLKLLTHECKVSCVQFAGSSASTSHVSAASLSSTATRSGAAYPSVFAVCGISKARLDTFAITTVEHSRRPVGKVMTSFNAARLQTCQREQHVRVSRLTRIPMGCSANAPLARSISPLPLSPALPLSSSHYVALAFSLSLQQVRKCLF